jgi:two-component system response regulator FixJ
MNMPSLSATIFVIDDDLDVLISLRFLLETEGFDVRTFANGPALLASDSPSPNDCLVVDYRMAGMNGIDLVRRLRDRAVSTPVVLITAYSDEGVPAKAAKSGIRHVVLKPHIEESLIAHVREAMDEASAAWPPPARPLREAP